MFFPPGLSYAIQALVVMPEDGHLVRVRELADKAKVPQAFLAKLMQRLGRAGLVEGHRGPAGGYRLGRPAHRITIRELATILDEDLGFPECVLTHKPCGAEPCVMHHVWGRLRMELETSILGLSIRDLQVMQDPQWKGLPPEVFKGRAPGLD